MGPRHPACPPSLDCCRHGPRSDPPSTLPLWAPRKSRALPRGEGTVAENKRRPQTMTLLLGAAGWPHAGPRGARSAWGHAGRGPRTHNHSSPGPRSSLTLRPAPLGNTRARAAPDPAGLPSSPNTLLAAPRTHACTLWGRFRSFRLGGGALGGQHAPALGVTAGSGQAARGSQQGPGTGRRGSPPTLVWDEEVGALAPDPGSTTVSVS